MFFCSGKMKTTSAFVLRKPLYNYVFNFATTE